MGRMRAPSEARLLAALAPPPGTMWDSRCLRIRTGASRETREISPYWNSSATKSPRRTIVFVVNCSTHSRRARRSTDVDAGSFVRRRFICAARSEEHTSELQSPVHLVCRLLLEKKNLQGQQERLRSQ